MELNGGCGDQHSGPLIQAVCCSPEGVAKGALRRYWTGRGPAVR
jgi:hypothetical protein